MMTSWRHWDTGPRATLRHPAYLGEVHSLELVLGSPYGHGRTGLASADQVPTASFIWSSNKPADWQSFQSKRAADSIVGHGLKQAGQSFRHAFNRRIDLKICAVWPHAVGAHVAEGHRFRLLDRVLTPLLGRRDLGSGRHGRFRRKLPRQRTCFDGTF